MYHGYGFVQYDRLEDVQAALDGEKGRLYKGYRLGKENWSLLSYLSMHSGRESAFLWKRSGKIIMWNLPGISLKSLLPGMYFLSELFAFKCCVVRL